MVEDNDKARFARTNLNYGLGRRLTVGAGMEYLSSMAVGKAMPFVHASFVLRSHLLVSAEHTYGVSSKIAVNYRLPSNLQFDLVYTRYAEGQTAIKVNQLDEKKLVVSMPMKSGKFTAFSRLTLNQFTFPYNDLTPVKATMKYTSAEYVFSSAIAGVNSNLTTYALFTDAKNQSVYSNLSLAFRLPAGIRFTPQAQYEYRQRKFNMAKGMVEKNLFARGSVNLAYERDLTSNNNSLATLGLRYNFSFAQTFLSVTANPRLLQECLRNPMAFLVSWALCPVATLPAWRQLS